MGKVVLLGAGPGDPDLLTIRGKEYIEKADCIIYDRLASPEILLHAGVGCEFIYVGKMNHHHTMKQDDINVLLYEKAQERNLVVRLKGGDPYVFGRGGEEALFLKERQVEVEVVPGISSAIAALSAAGIPITHRGIAKGFRVITAHSRKDMPADIAYEELLDPEVTCVFLMGLSHTGEIAENMIRVGRSPDTPCAVVSKGTTWQQKKCVATLETIEKEVIDAGLESPAIIVVGEVVRLTDRLDLFEKRPLFGKHYLLPYIEGFQFGFSDNRDGSGRYRAGSELGRMLREKGAGVSEVKVGKIVPLPIDEDEMISCLQKEWLVFTSRNGVKSFFWNLWQLGLDARSLKNSSIAAVGKQTAAELERFCIKADLLPDIQTGKALGELLLSKLKAGTSIVMAGAKQEDTEPEIMLKASYEVSKLACYKNVETDFDMNAFGKNADFDGIVFTAASSVRRVCKKAGMALPGRVFSIGPKCSRQLEHCGILQFEEAETASYKGLLNLLEKNQTI